MIHGILAVDKPQGWTSHDVVARVRRICGQREVGHAGTLDPLATGVLLVVLGHATRLSSYLMAAPKTYRAEIVLGASTVTDDAEGPISTQAPIPPLTVVELERCVEAFTGEIDQTPPLYAAVRHGGERLYRLARQGIEVEPAPRRVVIHSIDIEYWESPRLRLRVTCGSGTYIRSLARDIGIAAGSCAYLHALRRIANGGFSDDDAVRLTGLDLQGIERAIEPLDRAILDWPAAVLGPDEADAVRHGRAIRLGRPSPGNVRLYDRAGELLALARAGEMAQPFRVFQGKDEAG